MKCCSYITVLLLLFATVNATFWYKNDDFERVMDPYNSGLTQEYLRALSIFKRKLQLLGFYPLVLNDDGLEYVSMDPYPIEDDDDDDDDDELYKLLKQMKKEKKARKKLQKKKSKKSKKSKKVTEPPTPTVETTTVQPISNIVYYWPSAITTIVHPGQGQGASTYQHTFDTRFSIDDSREENISEVESSSKDKVLKIGEQTPSKINYQTSFTFGRRLDDDNGDTRATKNQTLTSTTPTTTPYPLMLTVFPDPEEVAIQKIIDQQEVVNKIIDNDQENTTNTVLVVEGQPTDVSVAVQDNLTETYTTLYVTETVSEDVTESHSKDTKNADKIREENFSSDESTTDDVTTDLSTYSTEPSPSIPAGALQFFHETLPDGYDFANGLPDLSEIFDNITVSSSTTDTNVSDKLEEITENNETVDGHRDTDTQPSHSIVQLNDETTTMPQPLDEHLITPKSTDGTTSYTESEVIIPTSESEGVFEYLIDPKITRPIKVLDVFEGIESRSLTDEPEIVAIDTSSARRSDVPIEADDIDEEDATDDLAFNSTGDKVEEAKVAETPSAEISTDAPPAVTSNPDDNYDRSDSEIIPLIPIIIKQMKQGNVSPEEMEILKNSFGPFWPIIVEEVIRENDSSEEMNPLLSELLNSVNRRIVKREATFGLSRPVYERRIYFDDDKDDVQYAVPIRRRYYRRRRRPLTRYYQKK